MNRKAIYWTVGGVAVAVLGYFAYKKITAPTISFGDFEDDDASPSPSPSVPSSSSSSSSSQSKDGLPLKVGSRGEKVKQLQRFLVAEGYDIGKFGINKDGVDGMFGSKTRQAVVENQQPFAVFKSMYPSAVEGQVSADFFNTNIKGRY